jgi:uncharacterized membrane protein YdjX (TVP38/TMEM64 family)
MEAIRTILASVVEWIGSAHPAVLFLAIAVLPLVGVPASPLLIAAGVRWGFWPGSPLAMTAMTLNFIAGYWLSNRWFREPLRRWLDRRGARFLDAGSEGNTELILLCRLFPGMPLFIQNYVLGVAGVPFGRYLVLSVLVQSGYVLAFVQFGGALKEATGWRMAMGVAGVIALALLVRWWRVRVRPAEEPSTDRAG